MVCVMGCALFLALLNFDVAPQSYCDAQIYLRTNLDQSHWILTAQRNTNAWSWRVASEASTVSHHIRSVLALHDPARLRYGALTRAVD